MISLEKNYFIYRFKRYVESHLSQTSCDFTIAANEDAPSAASTFEAMDPERRRWLEEAIESMTVDVVKQVIQVNHFFPKFSSTVEPHYCR